jgi:hypothetical protein
MIEQDIGSDPDDESLASWVIANQATLSSGERQAWRTSVQQALAEHGIDLPGGELEL